MKIVWIMCINYVDQIKILVVHNTRARVYKIYTQKNWLKRIFYEVFKNTSKKNIFHLILMYH